MDEEIKTKRPRRTKEERIANLNAKIDELKAERDGKIEKQRAKYKALFDEKAGEITETYAAKIAAVEEKKSKLQWPNEIEKLLKRIPKDMSPEEVAQRLGLQTAEDDADDADEMDEDDVSEDSDSENNEE